jgi:PrtD family type I secretion system ABC transporter
LFPAFREVLAMSAFVNLLALAVPVFVLQVYDRVVFHHGLSTLTALVIGMAFVIGFDFVLRQARARILQTAALRIDAELGRRLFAKIASLPLIVLEGRPTGYWQALFRDAEVVRSTAAGAPALLLCDLPFAIVFLGLIWVIAAPVAWIITLALVLFVALGWRSAADQHASTRAEREAIRAREALLAETAAGRATVKALALDAAIAARWEDRHADAVGHGLRRGSRADGYSNAAAALTMATTVAITAAGAFAILQQELTIGALIAANMLGGRLLAPLSQLVASWRTYAALDDAAGRLAEVFAQASERDQPSTRAFRPTGRLTLEGVEFTYPASGPASGPASSAPAAGGAARPVLADITLEVAPGRMVGLIGGNGSGKSTLLKLMQGLYPCGNGRVLLDGADIAQFTRPQLARFIGYVPQECVLFAGSIRDNIARGDQDMTDEQVVAAARAAGAHGFILDLPDGYATDVGEAGMRLSYGQRQRLAIARALLHDPPLLLLDEPSSNLDRDAEHALRDTLVAAARTRAVVVVTHARDLLQACDTLAVLAHGRLALIGPAAQVLRRLSAPPSAPPEKAAAAAAANTVPLRRPEREASAT